MPNSIELLIPCSDPQLKEILVAILSEAGADGIEERERDISVYFLENETVEMELKQILAGMNLSYQRIQLPSQNWNQSWESNFQPVVVDDLVGIRADFHEPIPNVRYELLITPKMSFGTGHHATTSLMIKAMMKLELDGKHVLDFGTGTGILAILAEKAGAASVLAIDNDDWSISNAEENLAKNNCRNIELKKADDLLSINQTFDIILANINLHVILENLASLKRLLKKDGVLLLSGLLRQDRQGMEQALASSHFILINYWEQGDWICLQVTG